MGPMSSGGSTAPYPPQSPAPRDRPPATFPAPGSRKPGKSPSNPHVPREERPPTMINVINDAHASTRLLGHSRTSGPSGGTATPTEPRGRLFLRSVHGKRANHPAHDT